MISVTALQRVLEALENAGKRWRHQSGGYVAQCPSHDDRNPSLSITNGNGKVLVNCHAGCDTKDIVAAIGLHESDLFDPAPDQWAPPQVRRITAIYRYHNADGLELFQKVRYSSGSPKFMVRRSDGQGGWIWRLGDDTPRVLYRLPEVLSAIAQGHTIYCCEGEKDADRVAALGHTATCNYDGAAKENHKSKWRPEYSDTLAGGHIVVIADNDPAGYAHAHATATSLRGTASSVRLVRPLPDFTKADLSDHLDAGHTLNDLVSITLDDALTAATTPEDDEPDDDPSERAFHHEVAAEVRKLRVRDEARRIYAAERNKSPSDNVGLISGGMFIHEAPPEIPTVWGRGDEVFWAQGEPLIITGPTGVGKTTLGGQIIAARMGLISDVLKYPVTVGQRVLYLAMDRPIQIARALGRLLRQYPRDALDEKITFWRGPPPSDIALHPQTLVELAQQANADTIVLDSLKDAAANLSSEEAGYGLNKAMQLCVAAGVDVLGYHHQTKHTNSGMGKPDSLADVYGSAWITAGAGSVILLWGEAGDPIIELRHLKQPAAEIGPLQLNNDFTSGTLGIIEGGDALELLLERPRTPAEVAEALFGVIKPTKSQVEKARRKIHKLVEKGLAVRLGNPASGGAGDGRKGGGDGARYGAAARADRSTHEGSGSVHASVHVFSSRSTRSSFPQVDRSTHPNINDHANRSSFPQVDRSTKSVHDRSTHSTISEFPQVDRSTHQSTHETITSPQPPRSPLRGVGGEVGDLQSTPDDDLADNGDRWVHAHLTTAPQTITQLATTLSATPMAIETALARLEYTGRAECHSTPGHTDRWSLPNKPTQSTTPSNPQEPTV